MRCIPTQAHFRRLNLDLSYLGFNSNGRGVHVQSARKTQSISFKICLFYIAIHEKKTSINTQYKTTLFLQLEPLQTRDMPNHLLAAWRLIRQMIPLKITDSSSSRKGPGSRVVSAGSF